MPEPSSLACSKRSRGTRIAATWATVGFLFAGSGDELEAFSPIRRPRYVRHELNPYLEPVGLDEHDDPLHLAGSLVTRIAAESGQEIASHTFSHYLCLEDGQDEGAFRADLDAACRIAESRGIRLRSIVFPSNQLNASYLPLLKEAGFVAYRGNQRGHLHQPSQKGEQGLAGERSGPPIATSRSSGRICSAGTRSSTRLVCATSPPVGFSGLTRRRSDWSNHCACSASSRRSSKQRGRSGSSISGGIHTTSGSTARRIRVPRQGSRGVHRAEGPIRDAFHDDGRCGRPSARSRRLMRRYQTTASSCARHSVVVLAPPCTATNIVTNALRAKGIDATLVVERPVRGWRLAQRRAKHLGATTVAGQVLFRLAAVPMLERHAHCRIAEILAASSLDGEHVDPTVQIVSVNDPAAREVLTALDPTIVVVVGTRIIAPATLACVQVPFVNLHAGITPRYRGVHGGYWALAEGRPDLVGSTVHLVDAGIDTGTVLRQATFEVTDRDSFATYPLLHLAAGVPQLVEVVEEVLAGKPLLGHPPLACGDSRLWHHPTLWGYLSTRRRQHIA